MNNTSNAVGDVLYEDEWLIAFDKPSGLLVAPDRWDKELSNLMQRVHERLSPDYMNVHRLDRDTSGVLLCAKNPDVGRRVAEQFEQHSVRKIYWAITRDGPQEAAGQIRFALAPDAQRPGLMRVHADGKEAETTYRVLERYKGNHHLVEVEPRTGRTHQIRVHLAMIGAPIVGDPHYGDRRGLYLSDIKKNYKTRGDERPLLQRLALLARSLTITHPQTGKPLCIEAPVPRDMEIALRNLRRYVVNG